MLYLEEYTKDTRVKGFIMTQHMILYPPSNRYMFSRPSVLVLDSLKSIWLFPKATVVWKFHLYGLHFSALWEQVIQTFRVLGKTDVYHRIDWNSKGSDIVVYHGLCNGRVSCIIALPLSRLGCFVFFFNDSLKIFL